LEKFSEAEQEQFIANYAIFFEQLKGDKKLLSGTGLQSATEGCQLWMEQDSIKTAVLDNEKEQIGGIFTIEAENLEEAKAIVGKHPGLASNLAFIISDLFNSERPYTAFSRTSSSTHGRLYHSSYSLLFFNLKSPDKSAVRDHSRATSRIPLHETARSVRGLVRGAGVGLGTAGRWARLPLLLAVSTAARAAGAIGMYGAMLRPEKSLAWAEAQ
jgi:hypothetical protein